MKKSIFIFLTATVLSIGMIVFGWMSASDQIGKARLTEETITGDRTAADGLIVAFRADSADDLHWINGFDYSTGKTASSFTRGEMETKAETSVYDDMRFTGWSMVPYYTYLQYEALNGLQDKKIQNYYDKLQKQALEDGKEKTGTIRTGDYLDYYPISFRFQFGEKVYNSGSALTGLKILADKRSLNEENAAPYAGDIDLYMVLNDWFRIPVIDNEYQDYNLVMAGPVGFPIEASTMQTMFNRLIEKHGLPRVVFHSLRHSSITYKLKLNGGDVKAVQGDSGHSQTSMVTDVYSHILDNDRRSS